LPSEDRHTSLDRQALKDWAVCERAKHSTVAAIGAAHELSTPTRKGHVWAFKDRDSEFTGHRFVLAGNLDTCDSVWPLRLSRFYLTGKVCLTG